MHTVKKIALMTWYHDNFGTVLQAVALQFTIESLGYPIDIVKYPVSGIRREGLAQKLLSYKRITAKLVRQFHAIKYRGGRDIQKAEAFAAFRNKHLHFTEPVHLAEEFEALNESYSTFVCGSDQIWSPILFNERYFLDFVHDDKTKVAYAPSFGVKNIADEIIRQKTGQYIKRFEHISVREEQGAGIIEKLTGERPCVMPDPTLLLTASDWEPFMAQGSYDTPYALCYFIGENEEYWNHAFGTAHSNGLPVRIIPMHPKDHFRDGCALKGQGPGEFLALIKNAAIVCTDSYHGVILSIAFGVPFFVYKRFGDRDKASQNSRVLDLLDHLQLRDRLVDYAHSISPTSIECDYSLAWSIIERDRQSAIEYLKTSLPEDACDRNASIHGGVSMREPLSKVFDVKGHCCGCAACFNICPSKAIRMEPDAYGFLYPSIDQSRCIGCGRCKKVCSFQSAEQTGNEPVAAFAAVNRDADLLASSSSGGVFGALAKYVLQNDGVVFGCAFNERQEPEHICIEDMESLKLLQGSKYVQSNINGIYAEAKRLLDSGREVLFTGTPCQVAGLNAFLGKEHENLLTADLVCHGVPSVKLFADYLHFVESKLGGRITEVNFRDKTKSWGHSGLILYKKSGKTRRKIIRPYLSSYYSYFLRGHISRESCYCCKYACGIRQGDFTMGDFWGVEHFHPEIPIKGGVSVLLANTQKAMKLLERLESDLALTKSTRLNAQAHNEQLNAPLRASDKRGFIYKLWLEKGYAAVDRIYFKRNRVFIAKSLIPRTVKEGIHKLLRC